jgi:hypothetical protein
VLHCLERAMSSEHLGLLDSPNAWLSDEASAVMLIVCRRARVSQPLCVCVRVCVCVCVCVCSRFRSSTRILRRKCWCTLSAKQLHLV